MAGFQLHPVLTADTLPVASLEVSELRLMNDARFAWCIRVPRMDGLTEWHELPVAARGRLEDEMDRVARTLLTLPRIAKINIGALGNRVSQLHIHVVGRHPGDPAWPGPVWGFGAATPYGAADAQALVGLIGSGVR